MQNNYQHTYAFEKLKVWKLSKELLKEVYLTTQLFPKTEVYGLTSQLRRSLLSVVSNLAEGSGRKSSKDKAHYTTMAYSSLMEALNQIIIAFELGYMKEEEYESFRCQIQSISYKLNSLRNSQLEEKV